MKGLFGEDIPETDKPPHGQFGRPARIGSGPAGETCGTCAFLLATGRNGKYKKCGLIPCRLRTHGPGTDLRCKDPACEKWERGA